MNLIQNKHLIDDLSYVADERAPETIFSDLPKVNEKGSVTLGYAWKCRENIPIIRVSGVTALHIAARLGNKRMMSYLLSIGADPTLRDQEGLTAQGYYNVMHDEYETRREYVALPSLPVDEVKEIEILLKQSKFKEVKYKKRLLIGEGDFSYAEALVDKHIKKRPRLAAALVATEYSPSSTIRAIHKEAFQTRIDKLEKLGTTVLFEIDGTRLASYKELKVHIFPRIHFNFPHNRLPHATRTLPLMLERFFNSCKDLQAFGHRVHLVLPYEAAKDAFYLGYIYGLFDASARSGYALIKVRRFGPERYPGYHHCKTGDNESAAVSKNALEYIFYKTMLTYEQILAHKEYGPKGLSSAYGEKNRLIRKLEVGYDSSDYEEEIDREESLPKKNKISDISFALTINHTRSLSLQGDEDQSMAK